MCDIIILDTCTKLGWGSLYVSMMSNAIGCHEHGVKSILSPSGHFSSAIGLICLFTHCSACVCLLLAGLGSELCGAGLHCWVQQNLRLDLSDVDHEDTMIQWWFISIKVSKCSDILPHVHVKMVSSSYSKPLQFTQLRCQPRIMKAVRLPERNCVQN